MYDLADVPWREDPSIPLASIAGLMDLGDDEDPGSLLGGVAAERP